MKIFFLVYPFVLVEPLCGRDDITGSPNHHLGWKKIDELLFLLPFPFSPRA